MGDVKKESSPKSTSIFLQIIEHQDGSITRPLFPLSTPNSNSSSVQTKDITLNISTNTWLRLYLPHNHQSKLPIILFLHGGGFVLFGPSALFYHQFCHNLSLSIPALVIALKYRLAPEHRLPAAYDDALDAICFVREASDSWITDYGDPSRFFVMGSSSGGNMAYHAGLRVPSKITGLVLNQPYFGGTTWTKSEAESEGDAMLPLRANDMMWRLALPVGACRDHEYCNPMATQVVGEIGRMPRCLVKGSGGDPLVDRQKEFVTMLDGAGVSVVARFEEDGYHAVELFDEVKAKVLFDEENTIEYWEHVLNIYYAPQAKLRWRLSSYENFDVSLNHMWQHALPCSSARTIQNHWVGIEPALLRGGPPRRNLRWSRGGGGTVLPLHANDMMWRLALPVGVCRDHEYCNPMATQVVGEIGWMLRCLVKGSEGDPLVDRQKEFVTMLDGAGVSVVARFEEDGYHAVELFDEVKAKVLFDEVRDFIHGPST